MKTKPTDTEFFKPIDNFGWEQGDSYVKVWITSGIEGVGAIPKENISVVFTAKGFDLKIKGLNGINYR